MTSRSVDIEKRAWLLAIPAFFFMIFTSIYPIFYEAVNSFYHYKIGDPFEFVGIGNYIALYNDPLFSGSLLTTIKFSALTVIFTVLVSLIVALVINEPFKGTRLIRALLLVPWAMSPVIAGLIWNWLFQSRYGLIEYLVVSAGIAKSVPFLIQSNWALFSITVASVWSYAPMSSFIFLSGLQAIPSDIYEAAKVDGANSIQSFAYVTLPLLRNSMLLVVTFTTMWALRAFGLIYSMTYGGPAFATTTLGWLTYLTTFYYLDIGKGASIAVILALITIALSVVYFKSLYRRVDY